jgi:hypothetical protein
MEMKTGGYGSETLGGWSLRFARVQENGTANESNKSDPLPFTSLPKIRVTQIRVIKRQL